MFAVFFYQNIYVFFQKKHLENINFDSVTDLFGWNRNCGCKVLDSDHLVNPKSIVLRQKKCWIPSHEILVA